MKRSNVLKSAVWISICILYMCSCAQELKNNGFTKIQANISGEFFGIIEPPDGSSLKNFMILDSEKKVRVNVPLLAQKKIIMLSAGDYEFSADGVQSKVFSLQEDCRITSNGKTFNQEALETPPALAFRQGQRWDIQTPLVEGSAYSLTILDMDNLAGSIPVSSYSAKITGNGINADIPLNSAKEDNRIIAASPRAFDRGSYTVTVSVNGDTQKIPPLRFNVVPKPPFTLTVNNTWEGRPLQFAKAQCFNSDTSVKSTLTRNEFDTFVYNNEKTILKINGERISSTGENGRLVLQNIHDGDTIVIMMLGINADEDVYTQTRAASENQKTINISWSNVPSRKDFTVQVPIDPYSLQSWYAIPLSRHTPVSMYYRAGKPATIPNYTALGGNGFTRVEAGYTREDDTIRCTVDLSRLSKVSQFIYLIKVDDEIEGTFMMNNTSDEESKSPEPLRKQE